MRRQSNSDEIVANPTSPDNNYSDSESESIGRSIESQLIGLLITARTVNIVGRRERQATTPTPRPGTQFDAHSSHGAQSLRQSVWNTLLLDTTACTSL